MPSAVEKDGQGQPLVLRERVRSRVSTTLSACLRLQEADKLVMDVSVFRESISVSITWIRVLISYPLQYCGHVDKDTNL
jgi:hypothetical protein